MNGSAAWILASSADRCAPDSQGADDTVVTPPCHAKQGTLDEKYQEKTLRFRSPVMDEGNSIVTPPVLHYHIILAAVQDAFGDTTIHFLENNNNQAVTRLTRFVSISKPERRTRVSGTVVSLSLSNADWWHSHQTLSTQMIAAQQSMFLIASGRTSLSMVDIKANEQVKNLLTNHNFDVNFHRWDETEWDIVQLGFFFGIDPTFSIMSTKQQHLNSQQQLIFKMPLRQKPFQHAQRCQSSN